MTSHRGAFALSCIFVVVSLLCGDAFAEVVTVQKCPHPENYTNVCTVHEVRVQPCKEAAEGKPCRLKRGRSANITFDYTADFEAETLEGQAFWVNDIMEMPFLGMERNACLSTPCPVVPGKKQTYSLDIFIAKAYPVGTYNVKWRMLNSVGQDCCFIVQIKIYK